MCMREYEQARVCVRVCMCMVMGMCMRVYGHAHVSTVFFCFFFNCSLLLFSCVGVYARFCACGIFLRAHRHWVGGCLHACSCKFFFCIFSFIFLCALASFLMFFKRLRMCVCAC
jgi:hypothetical protein